MISHICTVGVVPICPVATTFYKEAQEHINTTTQTSILIVFLAFFVIRLVKRTLQVHNVNGREEGIYYYVIISSVNHKITGVLYNSTDMVSLL